MRVLAAAVSRISACSTMSTVPSSFSNMTLHDDKVLLHQVLRGPVRESERWGSLVQHAWVTTDDCSESSNSPFAVVRIKCIEHANTTIIGTGPDPQRTVKPLATRNVANALHLQLYGKVPLQRFWWLSTAFVDLSLVNRSNDGIYSLSSFSVCDYQFSGFLLRISAA